LRQITKRNRAVSLEQMIGEANTFLAGWVTYFRQAHARSELRALDGWLRRKLRCVRFNQCKQPQGLRRFLKQSGVVPRQARELASSGRGWWDREEPPYSIYPAAERSKGGPRLSAGEAFLPYRTPGSSCFLLAPHRRCRPAVHKTANRTLSRRKPGPIGPPTERWKGGPRLSAGAAHLSYRAPEPSWFVLARRSNLVPTETPRHEIASSREALLAMTLRPKIY
jgi:hypothetical protein